MECLNVNTVLMIHLPLSCTFFPYTTLFRSRTAVDLCLIYSIPDHPLTHPRPEFPAVFHFPCGSHYHYNLPICLLKYLDRKSTRLNSSHGYTSYAVFCLKKQRRLPLT